MKVRISHCSTSLENYYQCINEKITGFLNRTPQAGDLVYIAVKVGKKTLCSSRFVLDEPTDHKPWPDAELYVSAFTIKDIEFCKPFDISILSKVGGSYWALKYVQAAKTIVDPAAIELLDTEFSKNKSDHLIEFEQQADNPSLFENKANHDVHEQETIIEDETELEEVIRQVPDAKVNIMGTFQTIHFSNETDKIKGLELLVNENFYSLFPQFAPVRTLLIPKNRLFKTEGFKVDGNNVQGIRTIPDGLLIVFDKKLENPFQINLIEYECYGEKKIKQTDKSNYLNSNIIPQLMRFASAFSIITDDQTREKTIKTWVDKIIDYINSDDTHSSKMISWIKDLNPEIKERSIEREIEKQLMKAFKSNLRVLLIIDELSSEQKSTIKNVVSSFKLSNGEGNVDFAGYVVRLVQKINMMNTGYEFALTVQ